MFLAIAADAEYLMVAKDLLCCFLSSCFSLNVLPSSELMYESCLGCEIATMNNASNIGECLP